MWCYIGKFSGSCLIIYINDHNDCYLVDTGFNVYLYVDNVNNFGNDSSKVYYYINSNLDTWMGNHQLTLALLNVNICQFHKP